MAQISTAISDFVLCISSFYGAGVIARRYNHAAIGLLIIALAAGVGTIRFLNIVPLLRRNDVISLHSKLSWFGAIVGVPLIAASFSIKYRSNYGFELHLITGIGGMLLSIFLPKIKDACTSFASILAVLSILFQSFNADNVLAMSGAILYALAGTVIGTSGHLIGYLRIDIFHYFLVVANIALVRALQ